MSVCSLEQGKLVQIEDEVKALDKTKVLSTSNPRTNKYSIRPTHGRANAYTSFKFAKQDSSNPWTRKRRRINLLRHQNNPTYGRVKGVNGENQ